MEKYNASAGESGDTLLAPDEPPPFELYRADGRADLLLVCDHASARVPRRLAGLGLAPPLLARHIAWDIGAAAVARGLALLLDAPLLLAGYSRLVIDCNRYLDDPSSIAQESDGVEVPGNRGLSPSDRAARAEMLFHPYQNAIAAALARRDADGPICPLIAVHSFTPVMSGKQRPWAIGILWDRDGRIAEPLMAALRADGDILVGDNEPYSAREPVGYTTVEHAESKGRPNVAVELRQDLVASEAGAAEWAERLARALGPILADPALHRPL
jgi:predicted N-formylglutamate amidohydrolase